MITKIHGILKPTWTIAWVLTLITLPVTSFPPLSRLAGGTLVAPFAMIPLAWLCVSYLPVSFFSRKPIPRETKPIFGFLIIALITSVASVFLDIPSYKDFTISSNIREGIITLGIGLAFFLVTVMMSASIKEMNSSLILLNTGGILLLLWSLIQIITSWLVVGGFPDWVVKIQSLISITEIQTTSSRFRVLGTTLEPSWLAHTLNMIYLPLWLGSTASRFSAFRLRVYKFTIENILLICGIIILIFTYSRIGLLAFSLVLLWFMILGGRSLARRFSKRFFANKPLMKPWIQVLFTIILILVLIISIGGLVYRLSLNDPRFAQLFEIDTGYYTTHMNIFIFANKLDMAERFVSWDLGWKVFEEHPVLGVGLGNLGMFTYTRLSSYAWKLPEITRILYSESSLPNSKNLWIRILAETGIVGFAFFSTWLIVLWQASRQLQKDVSFLYHALGLMGQFTLMALLLEAFSVDTFALPFLWISLGLVTSASYLKRKHPVTI